MVVNNIDKLAEDLERQELEVIEKRRTGYEVKML